MSSSESEFYGFSDVDNSESGSDIEGPYGEIVFSQKNKPVLSYEGYLYNFEREVRIFSLIFIYTNEYFITA